jgi:mycothiol synthase
MTETILPPGYTSRPATPGDAAGIHHLLNLYALEFLGHPDETLEDVEYELNAPQTDLVHDSRVVMRPDGFIAGYASM